MSSRLYKFGIAASQINALPQLAIAYAYSPNAAAYKYDSSTDTFTSLAIPSSNVTTTHNCVTYSASGKFIAFGLAGSPYFELYRRKFDAFTKVNVPYSPTYGAHRISFTNDDQYLLLAFIGAPYFQMFKLDASGENYSQLTSGLPTLSANVYSAVLSPDKQYLALGVIGGINFYKRNGDGFDPELPKATGYIAANHTDLVWNKDSSLCFAVNGNTSSQLVIYQHSGDVFSKLLDSTGFSLSSVQDIALSPDETHIALGVAQGFVVFKWNGSTLQQLTSLPSLPYQAHGVAYNEDGSYLVVGYDNGVVGAPRFSVFRRNGDTYTKLPDFGPYPDNTSARGFMVAFGPKAMN